MSDNIPLDVQMEIIKRVIPVKSVIRFISVCKEWKSLIDSTEFITHHTLNNTHPHHVLLRYSVSSEKKCVLVVDDDDHTFPLYNRSIPVPPATASNVMLDSSHGLVFLFGFTSEGNRLAVVWNPSTWKSVHIAPPPETTVVGFGVCPKTNDPKIFAITGSYRWVIHSGAYDQNDEYHQRIITFELTSEEFGSSREFSRHSMKNGQPVIERYVSLEKDLEVYEPDSNNMKGIGIYGTCFDMVNYTESLLLLNHSDSIIQ
ncbi:uncharacterized protein LOC143538769 [Bidens hawaiensis]|uniref:uncharacterized protein LOC143538769 n=1 Tax=Bidens hawaiensis TaxID=980011 RepID=UPI00404A4D90